MNSLADRRFKAYSAGSQPTGVVNPLTLQTLAALHLPAEGLHSKSWSEFAVPGSPIMDFVFTVCDSAAGEVCPVWPGQPMTAHWGVPDPAAVQGSEAVRQQAFLDVAITLKRRIELLLALPIPKLEAPGDSARDSTDRHPLSIPMTTHVLILCTHNSARSVLSEGMLNHWAKRLGKTSRRTAPAAHRAGVSTPSPSRR